MAGSHIGMPAVYSTKKSHHYGQPPNLCSIPALENECRPVWGANQTIILENRDVLSSRSTAPILTSTRPTVLHIRQPEPRACDDLWRAQQDKRTEKEPPLLQINLKWCVPHVVRRFCHRPLNGCSIQDALRVFL